MKKSAVSVISMLTGVAIAAGVMEKFQGDKLKNAQKMSDKHLTLFLMMNQWVRIKQEGKDLSSYFEKNGYKKIAVYGMSYAGETLVNELKNTEVEVAYGIDRNADTIYSDVNVVSMDDMLESVDVVVVTTVTFFDEIEEALRGKMDCPVISMEDILYDV